MMTPSFKKLLVCAMLLGLAACQSKVKSSPHVIIGKPYEISGTTYYPAEDPSYDEIGMGSWYGPGFHGKKTASGERFNQNDLTAAHPTLPMPSILRVTNLANGQSVIVRVNDRGPFKKGRIVDLSKKAAERIGMHSTMKVRVQYLEKETEEYIASLDAQDKKSSFLDMKPYNDRDKETQANAPLQSITSADLESPTASPSPAPVMVAPEKETTNRYAVEEEQDRLEVLRPASTLRNVPVQSSGKTLAKADKAEAKAAPAANEKFSPPKKAEQLVANGKYFVQLGAFSNKDNADKLVKKLSGMSGIASEKQERGGKTMWRVRAGPFKDSKAAEAALDKAKAAGASDARISH